MKCYLRLRRHKWDAYVYPDYCPVQGWIQRGFLRCANCRKTKAHRKLGATRNNLYQVSK